MTAEKTCDMEYKTGNIKGKAKPITFQSGNCLVKTSEIKEMIYVEGFINHGYVSGLLDIEDYYKCDFHNGKWKPGNFPERPRYGLGGKVYVARRKPWSFYGYNLPIKETCWEVQVDAYTQNYLLDCPDAIAQKVADAARKPTSIENQGIEIDLQSLTKVLAKALEPYNERFNHFCGEGGQFRRLDDGGFVRLNGSEEVKSGLRIKKELKKPVWTCSLGDKK
jgi:hypothetical protein